jgi:CDP-diacylglycerol--glycerol-3-phosphate 3-phosphatidyltransferase
MAATPVVMALVLAIDDHGWAQPTAAALFAVVSATDFFDGYLARRWGETTTLGTFLDTTSDKLLVSGVLIALVAVGRASSWVAFVIIARELVIMGVRAVVAAEGTVMTPSLWGKLKANVQFVAIFLAILDIDAAVGPWAVDQWALAIAAVVTALSGIDYLVRFWSAFHEPAAAPRGSAVSQGSVAPKAYDQTRV